MINLKNIYLLFAVSLLYSCSSKKLPDWIKGEWQQTDSIKTKMYWKFDNKGAFRKVNSSDYSKVETNGVVSVKEIVEPGRYIIQYTSSETKQAYFEIFKLVKAGEILFRDSSSNAPGFDAHLVKISK